MKKRAFTWTGVWLAAALLLSGCGGSVDSVASGATASFGADSPTAAYTESAWELVNTSNAETP